MLFIDDDALMFDGGISLVQHGAGSMMVSAFGTDYDEADDTGATFFPVVFIASGEVTLVDYQGAIPGPNPFTMSGGSNDWLTLDQTGGVVAEGTYTMARKATPVIPELHAAMLFGVGSLVVATRLRRRPRD